MFSKIGIVDSFPAPGTKPGEGAAAASFRMEMGNVLEIVGSNDNDVTGTLTLLRWFPPLPTANPQQRTTNIDPAGEWRTWREDAPMNVTAGNDFFSGRYEVAHDDATNWLLFVSPGMAANDCRADAQGAYYRRTS